MPLTMKDLAKMVGVSESTVSRAINGQPGVGQKTRDKILALAKEYQYQPNSLAQGLASQKTHTIGLLLPDITDPYFTQVVKGIEEQASLEGYHVILANTGGNLEKEISYLTLFQQNRCDGIIFVGGALSEEEILKLGLNKYPVVLVNKLLEELELPTLLIDHHQGALLAMNHLLHRGHERIGMIVGSMEEFTNMQLFDGYHEALSQANLLSEVNLIVEVENSRSGGYHGLLKLLDQEDPPTAIFAAGDFLAVGVIEAIKTGGYLIPEELAVIGYGETIVTEIIYPPLTTVRLPWWNLGKGAVEQLIRVIEDQLEESYMVLVPEVVRRQST